MEKVTLIETIAGVALLFTVFALGMARAYVAAKK
jgi:hypothetical protein